MIEIEGLTFAYPKAADPVLRGVNVSMGEGEAVQRGDYVRIRYSGWHEEDGARGEGFAGSDEDTAAVGLMLGAGMINAGLEIGLEGMRVGGRREVIVPPFTFVADIEAVLWLGAIPVFAEIDETLCLDPVSVREKISDRSVRTPAARKLLAETEETHGEKAVETGTGVLALKALARRPWRANEPKRWSKCWYRKLIR